MCISCKSIYCIMTLKGRRFSLDSSVSLDADVLYGGKRACSVLSSRKGRQSQSLDDARQEIQELNHSLNHHACLRQQPIAEEHHDQSEGPINNNSFKKHEKTFHKLFPEIPEGENLTHSFTCALQKEVLYHGKLYISENHVCFHSSVLLKETKVMVTACSVTEVKKHNSALSMLSIQTKDGEKYSFVSLRNREMCYKLLQTVCSQARGACSPHLSAAENEPDHEMGSSYSSLEDTTISDMSRQNSLVLDHSYPQMSSEVPTRSNSTRQNSLTDEGSRAVWWFWRILERVTALFSLREMRNLNVLFCIYMILMVLLLLESGYIGLRIIALEEQLNTLGALTEFSLRHREYQES